MKKSARHLAALGERDRAPAVGVDDDGVWSKVPDSRVKILHVQYRPSTQYVDGLLQHAQRAVGSPVVAADGLNAARYRLGVKPEPTADGLPSEDVRRWIR